MKVLRILIIPARRHIAESYCEYLVRYLGDEFWIDIGYPSINNDSPLAKDPDDYDLIYPQFDTHWFLDEEKYKHKIINVQFESGTRYPTIAACTSQPVCKKMAEHKHHLRFGVDTELFKPFKQLKDDKFHIGFMGNIQTPRRYMKELVIPLADLEGIKLDIYPTTWVKPRDDELENMGGAKVVENIVGGDKWLSGLPNLYNRMDAYIRADINPGYQFSLLEAASCGIPIITTDPGIGKEICDAGGGIYVQCEEGNWEPPVLEDLSNRIKEAVSKIDKDMGIKGRSFVKQNYTWEKWIPEWRKFFKYAYNKVQSL